MCDHPGIGKVTPPTIQSGKERPMKGQGTASPEHIKIKLLPKDKYDRVVIILGESVFDLQKEGLLVNLEESAVEIMHSIKEEAK